MKIIWLLLIVASLKSAKAEETTLFSGKIENGGYGASFIKFGQINGAAGVFIGGQGGWIINHKLALGAKGYVLVNDVEIDGAENTKLEFACWGAPG